MRRAENRPLPPSAAGPKGVQDLIAIPVPSGSTQSTVTFHEDGTADVTVYGRPGSLSFHPAVAVANPTRRRRTVMHMIKPGQS